MIKAQGKVKQRSDFKALLYLHIVIRKLVAMKEGITWVLVLFASITIRDVDAIQCYKCSEKNQGMSGMLNNACKGDDLGELMDCSGNCEKRTSPKTGGFFLTMNSGLACLALSFN